MYFDQRDPVETKWTRIVRPRGTVYKTVGKSFFAMKGFSETFKGGKIKSSTTRLKHFYFYISFYIWNFGCCVTL